METKTEDRNLDVQQIIQRLRNQSIIKRDFVIPSTSLRMDNGILNLILPTLDGWEGMLQSLNITTGATMYRTSPNKLCHEHIGEKLGINKPYYDKMLNGGHSHILDENVNYWLKTNRTNYLLRTFVGNEGTGIARALLSNSYKPIDNWDVAITILDIVRNHPTIQLEAADITDRKLYMRFTDPTIIHEAPDLLKKYRNGNPGIIAGFVISNSEVGEGAFSVAPRAVVLACKNGITRIEEKQRKVHLGSKLDQGQIKWSDKTMQLNMKLIQSQATDAISKWLTEDYLNDLTGWLLDIKEQKLEHPIDCTKNICSELSIADDRVESILNHFMKDGDISPLGIAQAVTFEAQSFDDADMQYEAESKVFDLVSNISKYDKVIKKK